MGTDNLIPQNMRTKEEQREIAIKGGIASGKARRLKKTMKQALLELLEENVKDEKGKPTDKTYQDLVNLGIVKGAMNGNALNYKTIVEMLGELEPSVEIKTPELNINVVDNTNLEKYLYNDDKK